MPEETVESLRKSLERKKAEHAKATARFHQMANLDKLNEIQSLATKWLLTCQEVRNTSNNPSCYLHQF